MDEWKKSFEGQRIIKFVSGEKWIAFGKKKMLHFIQQQKKFNDWTKVVWELSELIAYVMPNLTPLKLMIDKKYGQKGWNKSCSEYLIFFINLKSKNGTLTEP